MKSKNTTMHTKRKGLLRRLGETIGGIGHDLVEKSDSVISASQAVIEKMTGHRKQEPKLSRNKSRFSSKKNPEIAYKPIMTMRKISKKAAEVKVARAHEKISA